MRRGPIVAFVVCVASFVALALGDIATTSPTFDEPLHLASGYTQLTTGDCRFGTDHPPLIKRLAALPLLAMPLWPETPRADATRALATLQRAWSALPHDVDLSYVIQKQLWFGVRDERFGTATTTALTRADFLNDAKAIFFRARTTMLLATGVVLALLVFCWSWELWGPWAAAWSALLFCFDPSYLAHAGLVTTDAGAATLIFATVYFFWRLTRGAPLLNGAAFAICFAAAILTKFSAVLLGPMLVLLLAFGPARMRRLIALACAVVIAFVAIWAAYGFRYRASSAALPLEGEVAHWYATADLVARYPAGPPLGVRLPDEVSIGWTGRAVLLADRLHVLPQPFLYGFSFMRGHSLARGAFLRGRYSTVGFRSYFLWTFLYKTPLVTILAIAAGVIAALMTRNHAVAFLFVPVIVYLAVSMTSNINIGHRHLLPIYPFLYVAAGVLARRRIVFLAAPLVVASAFVVFAPWQPVVNRHLAYFNELAGGPLRGPELLSDSNVDWGQDLPRLAAWLREHDVREPVNLVYFGTADPRAYGIRYVNLERGYFLEPQLPAERAIAPGYLAISISALRGADYADHDRWTRLLRDARLAGRAGYSILIYRIEQPLR